MDDRTIWYKLKGDGSGQYEVLEKEEDRDDVTIKGLIGRITAFKLITCREEILYESIEENQMINNERYPI